MRPAHSHRDSSLGRYRSAISREIERIRGQRGYWAESSLRHVSGKSKTSQSLPFEISMIILDKADSRTKCNTL